jgi:surface protein
MSLKSKYFLLKNIYILFLILVIPEVINEDKNDIIMTINARIGKDIINPEYYMNISKLLINGTERNLSDYKNYLDEEIYIISITFFDKLNSLRSMFRRRDNILNVYFSSNFDTSSVTNMAYMFQYCESLISLDLSNFNTISVTNMELMFYSCI